MGWQITVCCEGYPYIVGVPVYYGGYLYIVGRNPLQKFNVFLAVESSHVWTRGNVWPEHLKIQLKMSYKWVE